MAVKTQLFRYNRLSTTNHEIFIFLFLIVLIQGDFYKFQVEFSHSRRNLLFSITFCEILQFSCLILFKQNFFGVLLYVQAPDEPKVEKLGTVDFPINPCKTGQLL